MSSFTNALIVKKKTKQEWETVEKFTYEVGKLGSGEAITVPAGFITDLASIPRIFWIFYPSDSNYSQASVLHDWMVVNKGYVDGRYYNYKQTTAIFFEAMGVLNVSYISRKIIYYSVLFFGPRF